MATSNFYKKNADKYYVVMPSEEEARIEDINWWNDKIKEIQDRFSDNRFSDGFIEYNKWISRDTRMIGRVEVKLHYLNTDFYLYVDILLRSGYYEGANLDYDWKWYILNDYFDIDNLTELDGYELVKEYEDWLIDYNWDVFNMGIWAMHKERLAKKLDNLLYNTTKDIEETFKEISIPMDVVARFSNGETWYAKSE